MSLLVSSWIQKIQKNLFDTWQISVTVWPASHAAWTPAKMLSILVPAVVPSWVFTRRNKLQWDIFGRKLQKRIKHFLLKSNPRPTRIG